MSGSRTTPAVARIQNRRGRSRVAERSAGFPLIQGMTLFLLAATTLLALMSGLP